MQDGATVGNLAEWLNATNVSLRVLWMNPAVWFPSAQLEYAHSDERCK